MEPSAVELAVSVPSLRAIRWTTDSLYAGLKEHYAVGRVEQGHSEYWGSGKVWRSAPGSIQVKQPGDVHRDLVRDGPGTITCIVLPATEIARVQTAGRVVVLPQLELGDERAAPFHRLHDAVHAQADRLALEVALAEAINAFSLISSSCTDHTRPVRRAMACLREHVADSISLDELAAQVGLDKYHLCRAFRDQVGMPPHAYLTHLRVARAKELLRGGKRASEVAALVGFYDQAQLTRHFRRIVGTTPANYGRSRPVLGLSPEISG